PLTRTPSCPWFARNAQPRAGASAGLRVCRSTDWNHGRPWQRAGERQHTTYSAAHGPEYPSDGVAVDQLCDECCLGQPASDQGSTAVRLAPVRAALSEPLCRLGANAAVRIGYRSSLAGTCDQWFCCGSSDAALYFQHDPGVPREMASARAGIGARRDAVRASPRACSFTIVDCQPRVAISASFRGRACPAFAGGGRGTASAARSAG